MNYHHIARYVDHINIHNIGSDVIGNSIKSSQDALIKSFINVGFPPSKIIVGITSLGSLQFYNGNGTEITSSVSEFATTTDMILANGNKSLYAYGYDRVKRVDTFSKY